MIGRSLALSVLLILSAANAIAEQDFYGIQIMNERWAKSLVWKSGPPADQEDLKDGPILNHDVTGEASLKETVDGGIDFRITIFNGTKAAIRTDFDLRDFYVTTQRGQNYPLIDNQDLPELETIEPKSSVTFGPSFGNLKIRNKDVVMIECSFDLGKTKVFLFPWSEKTTVTKLVSPVPSEEPVKNLVKEKSAAEEKPLARKKSSPAPAKESLDPPRAKWKTPRRNFWEWLSGKNRSKASRKGISPEPPTPSAVVEQAEEKKVEEPPSGERLEEAAKKFVYVPAKTASKIGDAPQDSIAEDQSIPRAEARVVSFNKEYHFVTLNAGSRDGLRGDMVLDILRDGRMIAKARVKQIREAVSAATVLPEFFRADIKSGDQVSLG